MSALSEQPEAVLDPNLAPWNAVVTYNVMNAKEKPAFPPSNVIIFMASVLVETFADLAPVYGEGNEDAIARYKAIEQRFKVRYGNAPEVYARSPGRVNLIGEHIDYEGYPVLPMAIHLDTVVALRRSYSSGCLELTNLGQDKYSDVNFPIDPNQEVDAGKHNWGNYFLAAYKGVFEHLAAKGMQLPTPVGLQVVVHGRVPTGSGLSSSTALVCSSALAILAVFGFRLQKGEVAEFTARAERYVGTIGGGMDQAVSLMGMPGKALRVDFNPVRATEVHLPPGSCFVVCNSMAVSNKAETATGGYNLRVVECRLAAAVLAVLLGESKEAAAKVRTLKEIEPLIAAKYNGPGAGTPATRTSAVEQLLHEGSYDTAEIEGLLGTKLTVLYEGAEAALRVLGAHSSFKLHDRALHVYAEAQRVLDFHDECNGDAPLEAKLARLGQLMDASHASCRDLYECSCPELDTLVSLGKSAGAIGARLTGAGWGGCTVSLVRDSDVDGYVRAMTERYLQPLVAGGRLREEELPETIFASKPYSGGAVLRLEQPLQVAIEHPLPLPVTPDQSAPLQRPARR